MAFSVRRIVTGHDSNGKAIVATDEQLPGTVSPSHPGISRCEVWSANKMPVDNSEGAAAEAQRKGFVVRHNYVGSGQGNVCRIVEFSPGGTPFMHRTETLDYAILLKGECDLELDGGKRVRMKPGDICLHHTNTIHRSGPNTTAKSRRQLALGFRSSLAKRDEAGWARYQAQLKQLHEQNA